MATGNVLKALDVPLAEMGSFRPNDIVPAMPRRDDFGIAPGVFLSDAEGLSNKVQLFVGEETANDLTRAVSWAVGINLSREELLPDLDPPHDGYVETAYVGDVIIGRLFFGALAPLQRVYDQLPSGNPYRSRYGGIPRLTQQLGELANQIAPETLRQMGVVDRGQAIDGISSDSTLFWQDDGVTQWLLRNGVTSDSIYSSQ